MSDKLIPFQVRHDGTSGKWCVDYGDDGPPVVIAACFDDEASAWNRAEKDGLSRTQHFTAADSE